MEICKLEGVSKSFTMGEKITPLIDINLQVMAGDFIAIEGSSGTGKSTLLYVLGTLLKADSGKYLIEGKDPYSFTDSQVSELRAKKIGFLFQETNLIQALSIKQNIEFISKEQKVPDKEVEELLAEFGLSDRKDFLPFQLSGGQRRRAGAVRSLIHKPMLILADEPNNDLDDHWSNVMITQLKKQTERGAAVIMVSHNDISKYADRRYRLKEGKLQEITKHNAEQ
ncbi:MAG: ABC transporter ATP-binding protein [Treponema sp.]